MSDEIEARRFRDEGVRLRAQAAADLTARAT